MMSAVVSLDIKNEIFEICRRHGNIYKFFVLENIPSEKLSNAIKRYASIISEDEVIIFLYDYTVFGSANDGFVLTSKRLYFKNIVEKGRVVDIADIRKLSLEKNASSQYIVVKTPSETLQIRVHQATQPAKNENALFDILDKTIRLLKKPKTGNIAREKQIPASRPPTCAGCGARNPDSFRRCEYCDSPL